MCGNVIWIGGYKWHVLTNETTAETIYRIQQVRKIAGDPNRTHEIEQETSST